MESNKRKNAGNCEVEKNKKKKNNQDSEDRNSNALTSCQSTCGASSSDVLSVRPSCSSFSDEKLKNFLEYLNQIAKKGATNIFTKNNSGITRINETGFYSHYVHRCSETLFLVFNARGLVVNTE